MEKEVAVFQKRKQSTLPPYSFLLKLSLVYKTESAAISNAQKLNKKIIHFATQLPSGRLSVSPPMPAFHERLSTGFCWQIVLKAKSRKDLLTLFDSLDKNPHLHYDFDPISLL